MNKENVPRMAPVPPVRPKGPNQQERKTMKPILSVVFASLFFVLSAYSQTQTTGAIAGFVKDQSGALIRGVEVEAEQQGTGVTRTTLTNETGGYTLPLLPASGYTVNFSLAGFQTVISCDVRVAATEKISLDATLVGASANTSVEVSATAQLVQSESTTLTVPVP
jgi:hypothetical protein